MLDTELHGADVRRSVKLRAQPCVGASVPIPVTYCERRMVPTSVEICYAVVCLEAGDVESAPERSVLADEIIESLQAGFGITDHACDGGGRLFVAVDGNEEDAASGCVVRSVLGSHDVRSVAELRFEDFSFQMAPDVRVAIAAVDAITDEPSGCTLRRACDEQGVGKFL